MWFPSASISVFRFKSPRLRYRLAWDHDLCRRVTAVFLRAVFRLLRDHACAAGLDEPRGGAVATDGWAGSKNGPTR